MKSPVPQVTGFVGFLVRHWILAIVFVVVVVLFLSRPIANFLADKGIPFLSDRAREV